MCSAYILLTDLHVYIVFLSSPGRGSVRLRVSTSRRTGRRAAPWCQELFRSPPKRRNTNTLEHRDLQQTNILLRNQSVGIQALM